MIETNLYVMFKVKKGECMATDWCVPKEQFRSFRGKQVILRFDSFQDDTNMKKCDINCKKENLDFKVFLDLDNIEPNMKMSNNKFKNCVVDWYLGKYHVTGFRNFKYNGIPISDTWLNPNIIDQMIL